MARLKIRKRCSKGHTMQVNWRSCPRCTGRSPVVISSRSVTEQTMDDRGGAAGADRTVILGAESAAVPAAVAPAPAKAARLIALSGPPAGRELSIPPGRTKVGKAPSDIPGHHRIAIDQDSGMSRNHALVELEGDHVTIADTGSRNGTYVNGARVERAVLRPGDTIQLGESVFRFERTP